MNKLPIKITPCPIIEANLEIRFTRNNIPSDAVIGIIYNLLSSKYTCQLEQRPIMQLPPEIRSKDPQFTYQPTHVVKTSDFSILIGPQVVTIAIQQYPGWNKFRAIIKNIVSIIINATLIKQVDFIGLRYVNFFTLNIFDYINLHIEGLPQKGSSTIFRTEFKTDTHINVLQISNGVHVKNQFINADGSLLDITTVVNTQHGLNIDNLEENIDTARCKEKELFFFLLKDDYLKTLSPIYE